MNAISPARRSITMLRPAELSWWLWLASAVLLAAWLAGTAWAFWALLSLCAFQVAWFRVREGRFAAFPVQVRIAYGLLIASTAWEPLHWLAYVPAIGTWAQVIFGYCALARILSLLPWNRREALTWGLVARTFLTPPATGSILQAPWAPAPHGLS